MSIVGQTAHIDRGVTDALATYFAFGIDPGSFGMALLRGDREAAYASAHEALKPADDHEVLGSHGSEDVVATMLEVTESSLPQFARGEDVERWIGHKGLSGAPESLKVMAKLGIENPIIWNLVAKRHPEVMANKHDAQPA
jgi:hypothetical protein